MITADNENEGHVMRLLDALLIATAQEALPVDVRALREKWPAHLPVTRICASRGGTFRWALHSGMSVDRITSSVGGLLISGLVGTFIVDGETRIVATVTKSAPPSTRIEARNYAAARIEEARALLAWT